MQTPTDVNEKKKKEKKAVFLDRTCLSDAKH